MSPAPTVAILFHESITTREMQTYRAFRCAEHWKEWGFRIRILHGIGQPPDADLLIPQVNLSVMPEPYREYLDAHPRVVNCGQYDVRRTTFSRNLVTRQDSYDGPVVVKTNANYGGQPEHRAMTRSPLLQRLPYDLRRLRRRVSRKLASGPAKLAYADFLQPRDYQVFSSKRELPDSVFDSDSLVVEKFRPERHGEFYVSRNFAFFGSAGITVWEKSKRPLIRGDPQMQLEIIPGDEKIRAIQKSLGMEYGKLDYALENGEVVLFDVNLTPCSNFSINPEIKRKIVEAMSQGIWEWFPDARPGRR